MLRNWSGLCGDANVPPLAHMLDATQLVWGGGGWSSSLHLHMLTFWMLPRNRQALLIVSSVRPPSPPHAAEVVFNQVYALFFVVLHLKRMLHLQSCGYGWPGRQESLQVRILEKDTILLNISRSRLKDLRIFNTGFHAPI